MQFKYLYTMLFLAISTSPALAECPISDLNGDCVVNLSDFTVMSSEWMMEGVFESPDCINVRDYGAKGDGITDDTNAFLLAITEANGQKQIYVPHGIYILDKLNISIDAYFILSWKATLKHKEFSPSTSQMICITGKNVIFRGGIFDGNKENQSSEEWPILISAQMTTSERLEFHSVHFQNIVRTGCYINQFRGKLVFNKCHFTNMSESPADVSDSSHYSCGFVIVSGVEGETGDVTVNNCRFSHNVPSSIDGYGPGGFFINAAPGLTTLEVTNCHFYGIGHMNGYSDISPIHCYPTVKGARIIGNYFEQCGFCAISGKSVENFICIGNYIINGQETKMNIFTEGAISYAPGYQSGTICKPRAIIANNIIDTPGGTTNVNGQGGTTYTAMQYCIAVHGIETSKATDVLISNNILKGGGAGVYADWVTNMTVANNIIEPYDTNDINDVETEHGVYIMHSDGNIHISDNIIKTGHGGGIVSPRFSATCSFDIQDNTIINNSDAAWGIEIRGANFLNIVGNTIDASGSVQKKGYYLYKDIEDNHIKHLAWRDNTMVGAYYQSSNWEYIDKASGALVGTHNYCNPIGLITPAEIGTTFIDSQSGDIYIAIGLTNVDWKTLLTN